MYETYQEAIDALSELTKNGTLTEAQLDDFITVLLCASVLGFIISLISGYSFLFSFIASAIGLMLVVK